MTLVAIKDLRANPYRRIERYPIKPEKVDALCESFRTTSYWDNIVGRQAKGTVQIAYGHHRLEALKAVYRPTDKVQVITRDLSDEEMLQIMARENLEVFGTSSAVEQETVRAVVEAAAKGTIKLEEPPADTHKPNLRYAPSFVPGQELAGGAGVAYTTQSIGKFLGWLQADGDPQRKVLYSLQALELIEEGRLEESVFDGLTSAQAQRVVEKYRQIRKRELQAARADMERAEQKRRAAEERSRRQKEEQERLEREAAEAQDEESRERARLDAEAAARKSREAEIARKRAEEDITRERERRRQRETKANELAKDVGEAIAEDLKAGGGIRGADEVAERVAPAPEGPPPRIKQQTQGLAKNIAGILTPEGDRKRLAKLIGLVKYRDELEDELREELIAALEGLAGRAQLYARKLGGKRT